MKINGVLIVAAAEEVGSMSNWCRGAPFHDRTERVNVFQTFRILVTCDISDLEGDYISIEASSRNIQSGTEISRDENEERPRMTVRVFERGTLLEWIGSVFRF